MTTEEPQDPEQPRDVLRYAAASLDDVRGHLDAAQAAATTAVAYIRLVLMRDAGEGDES